MQTTLRGGPPPIDLVGECNAVIGKHFNCRGGVYRIDNVNGPLDPFMMGRNVCRVVLSRVRDGHASDAELAELDRSRKRK